MRMGAHIRATDVLRECAMRAMSACLLARAIRRLGGEEERPNLALDEDVGDGTLYERRTGGRRMMMRQRSVRGESRRRR